jgi:hypothetical protein
MKMSHHSIVKAAAAAIVTLAVVLPSSATEARASPWAVGDRHHGWSQGTRPPSPGMIARRGAVLPGLAGPGLAPPPRAVPMRLAEGRPSAAAIEDARRRNGLPATARAVGWRLVDGAGGKVWKIIFRVGNRQVAVEVPAGG